MDHPHHHQRLQGPLKKRLVPADSPAGGCRRLLCPVAAPDGVRLQGEPPAPLPGIPRGGLRPAAGAYRGGGPAGKVHHQRGDCPPEKPPCRPEKGAGGKPHPRPQDRLHLPGNQPGDKHHRLKEPVYGGGSHGHHRQGCTGEHPGTGPKRGVERGQSFGCQRCGGRQGGAVEEKI